MDARRLAGQSRWRYWPSGTDDNTRNPLLLFVFVGSLSLRLADRTFLALLFQEPPRNTREPLYRRPVPLRQPPSSRPSSAVASTAYA